MIRRYVALVAGLIAVGCSGTPRPGSPEFARDTEAHAFGIASNVIEIEEAQLAMGRGTRADVRLLGQQIVNDHARALAAHDEMSETFQTDWGLRSNQPSDLEIIRGDIATTRALPAPPPPSDLVHTVNRANLDALPASADVMRNHDQAMGVLRGSADGAAFDASFIKRQIELHRYLIARIDQILPEVTTKELRRQLESDRAMLDAHLRVAASLPNQ